MKKMKWKLKLLAAIAIVASVVVVQSCKEDDPTPLELSTVMAGTIDLNGATSPNNVPPDATITIVFTTDVDASTATGANVKLQRDYDDADIPLIITATGNTLTVKPTNNLNPGALFILSVSEGLKSNKGLTLTALTRNFSTAGVFAPDGAKASWTFEDNANDVISTYDPAAAGIVAITYGASHNAAAGKAAIFNGTTSIIEVPSGDLLMQTTDFTISFWMKTALHSDDANKGHFVMGLGAFFGFQFEIFGGYGGFKMPVGYAFNNNGTIGWHAEDNAFNGDGKNKDNGGWKGYVFTKDLTASGGVANLIKEKWAHVVFTYNATTKHGFYFVNGEKMREFDFNLWTDDLGVKTNKAFTTGLKYNGTPPDVVNELAFGFVQSRAGTMWDAEPWGGYGITTANHFKGSLDDVIIYHKVISEAEILLMYNSGK